MDTKDLKDILTQNENCYFNFYKNGLMYYSFFYELKECLFPIPIIELVNEEMRFTVKSMRIMNYLRRALIDKTIIEKSIE